MKNLASWMLLIAQIVCLGAYLTFTIGMVAGIVLYVFFQYDIADLIVWALLASNGAKALLDLATAAMRRIDKPELKTASA